jgi:hypothetical protein
MLVLPAYRYIMKDKSEPHFSLPFMVGGCDRAFLERCLQDYQVVASFKYNKDGQLQPDSFMKAVTIYINKHLSPLDIHPIQAVRLMLLEKYYQLGEKWCKPGALAIFSHRSRSCFGFAVWFCLLNCQVCHFPAIFLPFSCQEPNASLMSQSAPNLLALAFSHSLQSRCLNHPSFPVCRT